MRVRARLGALIGFGCAAVLLTIGVDLVATAYSAFAAPPTSGGVLQLVATPGVLADNSMAPGDVIYWPINAELNASTSGELRLQIQSSEPLATDPGGLRLALASCPVAWDISLDPTIAPTCQGGTGTTIIPNTAFADISPVKVWDLGMVSAVTTTPTIATISLPDVVPVQLQGAAAHLDFGFTALGDTEHASPNNPAPRVLGVTGIDPTGPALLAAGLLIAGITFARLRGAIARREAKARDRG